MLCPALIFKVIIFFLSLGYSYGVVPSNHMHLRIELSTEHKEHPEQLIKVSDQYLTDIWQLDIYVAFLWRMIVHWFKVQW